MQNKQSQLLFKWREKERTFFKNQDRNLTWMSKRFWDLLRGSKKMYNVENIWLK